MAVKVWAARALKRHATVEPVDLTPRQHAKPRGLQAKINRDGELPDNLDGGHWPIVSARLKAEVASFSVSFPIKIVGLDGDVRKDKYFLLNPKHQVNCIEWKKCEIEWSGERHDSPIVAFDRLALHGMNGDSKQLIFGACELYGVLFVRPTLIKQLKAKAYTGLSFANLSGFSRVAIAADPQEAKEKQGLIKLASQLGRDCAEAVDIEDADLVDQADSWWHQDGVMAFEAKDIALPDAWLGEVAAAYSSAWVRAAKSETEKNP